MEKINNVSFINVNVVDVNDYETMYKGIVNNKFVKWIKSV